MKIWIVVVEDRHTDVAPYPFSDRDQAISQARRVAESMAKRPEDLVDMTAELEVFPYYVSIGTEDDCVWVVERDMDEAI